MERVEAERTRGGFAKAMAILTIIGAINWGLIGFFNWNLVNALFGGETRTAMSALSRLIYAIVGLSGVALALTFPWRKYLGTTTTTPKTNVGFHRRTEVRP